MRRAVAMAYPPPGISGHCIKCVVVIASGATQSPADHSPEEGDCFVATLLAMAIVLQLIPILTPVFSPQEQQRQRHPHVG
jgi:hypothetical protein